MTDAETGSAGATKPASSPTPSELPPLPELEKLGSEFERMVADWTPPQQDRERA